MIINGIRTDSCSGKETTVQLTYYVRLASNRWYLKLKGGPTGYESISMEDLRECVNKKSSWTACDGAPYVWDRLVIPKEELAALLEIVSV